MINIREKQFKVIDKSVYIGIELEQKMSSFKKNSNVNIEFLNNGKKVFENNDITIPFPIGDTIFIGKEITTDEKFDDINVQVEEGETSLEEFDNKNVELEFDKEQSTKNKIVYKVKNNTKRTFDFLTLNLVFYNKGELVGGTDVTLKNVLNGRTYYFEYDVPKKLEYTDHNTYLFVPPTNRLIFAAFYRKYNEYIRKINQLLKSKALNGKDNFVNPVEMIDERIKITNNQMQTMKKNKTKSIFRFILKNIPGFLISAIISIPRTLLVLIIIGIIQYFVWPSCPDTVSIIIIVITYLYCIISKGDDMGYFHDESDYISKKEKRSQLAKYETELIKLQEEKSKAQENLGELEKSYTKRCKEIDEDNEKIVKLNEKNKKEAEALVKEFEEFKNEYPKYRVLDSYDGVDFNIIDNAIQSKIYNFEAIEKYRKEVHEKMEESYRAERELALLQTKNEIESQKVNALRELQQQNAINAEKIRDQIRTSSENEIYNANMNSMINYFNTKDGLDRINDSIRSSSADQYNQLLDIRKDIDFYK